MTNLRVSDGEVVPPAQGDGLVRSRYRHPGDVIWLVAAVPLLQPLALSHATGRAVRRQPELLGRTRAAAAAASSAAPAELPRLQRVRPRTLLMIAAAAGAFYFILPQLAQVGSSWRAFQSVNWVWVPVIVVLSSLTYLAGAIAITGSVAQRLPFLPTLTTQLASSFVNRVSPANVGGMALNVRYLQKGGVDPGSAVAAVGLNSLAGGIVHAVLLVLFFVWSGSELTHALHLPSGSKLLLALAALAAIAGALLTTRWGRRRVLAPVGRGLRAALRVWVPRMSSGLCDLRMHVLVDHTGKPLTPADNEVAGRRRRRGSSGGRGLAEGAVRPAGVVVLYVDREYVLELAAVDDQDPVEQFSA
jgi:uncharacterized membrane protein YbhN (UPF0104 family)